MNSSVVKHVIIGGTTKAGTTSLFKYLGDHPDICASNNKETRFFLEANYPLKKEIVYESAGISGYDSFFCHCNDRPVRLEATPDYLYSQATPRYLNEALGDVVVIFILRDPAERLLSWFRFAKQRGLVSSKLALKDYVNHQLEDDEKGMQSDDQWFRSLQEGKYAKYIRHYIDILGTQRILVVDYKQLSNAPRDVINDLCARIGVSGGFYDDYEFKTLNKTVKMRSPYFHKIYSSVRANLRRRFRTYPRVHALMRSIRRLIEPIYLMINSSVLDKKDADVGMEKFLTDYYAKDQEELKVLLSKLKLS